MVPRTGMRTGTGTGELFWGEGKVLGWIVVVVAQLCIFTKKSLHLQWVNFVVCKLCLNNVL